MEQEPTDAQLQELGLTLRRRLVRLYCNGESMPVFEGEILIDSTRVFFHLSYDGDRFRMSVLAHPANDSVTERVRARVLPRSDPEPNMAKAEGHIFRARMCEDDMDEETRKASKENYARLVCKLLGRPVSQLTKIETRDAGMDGRLFTEIQFDPPMTDKEEETVFRFLQERSARRGNRPPIRAGKA